MRALPEFRVPLAGFGLVCALAVALASGALARPPSTAEELTRLEQSLAAHPEDEVLRAKYGEALLRAGDALGSLRVLNPDRVPGPEWVPELRASAQLYRKRGNLIAARKALRDAVDLAPDDRDLYAELSEVIAEAERASAKPEPASAAAAPPASALSAPAPAPAAIAPTNETIEAERRRTAAAARPAAPRKSLREAISQRTLVLAGAGLALVAIALLLRRALRGSGDVAVSIELPPDARATLSVRLSRERERQRPPPQPGAAGAARASSRFEHNMVARETHFRAIPAGRYWLTIEGVVEHGAGRDGVREDREVVVAKGQAARAEFDLRPQQCPVEVRVVREGERLASARVALGGDPTSLRRTRDGVAKLALPLGEHVLLVGADDRAAERKLALDRIAPVQLEVDLGDASALTFSGCEAAVEPYLRGDLSVAAAALERAGQRERAAVLAGRFYRSRGSVGNAAERFEAAGRWLEAAELRAEAGEWARAATLFERAGDLARAAEMHNAGGELLRAGAAYEQAGDFEAASVCYREAGDERRLLEALEKKGEFFEAGEIAGRLGEGVRAIRNLQQIDSRHRSYLAACRLLAAAYSEQGKHELAMQKAEEAVTFSRPEDAGAETLVWYGNLLARAGRTERAIEVLEQLAERAPEHPGLLTRLEELRKDLSAARREGSATQPAARSAFGDGARYELREQIGSGGMGVVMRALDRRLGREVALKRLPENLRDHPKAVDLFLREARAAAALNHPNIVTVHDVDEDNGVYFITMELLVGRTLSQVLKQHGRLAWRDAARVALQVAAGLGYAHGQRIVHRDIKSSNLFLTDDRIVKVMDFGLAKMLEEVRRGATVIGGTPYYMAPEQAAGDAVDARADLYAFGVTLFELVVGQRPFETGDVAYHHRHTPAPDPRSLGAPLPEPFAALILQMMAKSPADRPANTDQVAQRLRAILGAPKK
jgi:tetratricopeptide (TPR) repeat protein